MWFRILEGVARTRPHQLIRTTCQSQSKLYSSSVPKRRYAPTALLPTIIGFKNIHCSAIGLNKSDVIDRNLLRMDQEIRRTGRVSRQEIEEILSDIHDMKKATSNQSLMILRCCGELVPGETPENRTKLVAEVWETMEKLNVPMDISHYNALLRVYLENEHKFDPRQFLEKLNHKGIEPNRVTFQRLIARFCQEGDIDGASTILQHMKEKQLPINEHVFNALILGHANANDMESAEGIIGVMKQAGLEPNDDTYTTLMCGYAKKGDMENVHRIVKHCQENDVFLVDRDFFNVIFILAQSGQQNLVEQIIPYLRKHSGFNQDATNTIFKLINVQQEEIAYRILKLMPMSPKFEEMASSGNFFVKQMVRADTPTAKIISYCEQLKRDGLNAHALGRACEMALSLKKVDKAFEILEAMFESGSPIRQHYFWPIFSAAKTEKEVLDAVKTMAAMDLSPSVETLRDYIIPAILSVGNNNNQPLEVHLGKLSSYTRVPDGLLTPAAMQFLLNSDNLDAAINFAMKYRVSLQHVQMRRALVDAYVKSKRADAFVKIGSSLGVDGDDYGREGMSLAIMELLNSTRLKDKRSLLLPVLKEMLANGVGLSNSGAELIQSNMGEEVNEDVLSLTSKLTSSDLTCKLEYFQGTKRAMGYNALDEKSTADLESLLIVTERLGNSTKGIKKNLLFNYCRERKLEKAQALKKELLEDGFVLPPGLQALVLDLYSASGCLEEARAVFQELKKSMFTMDDLKILRYSQLLFSNGLVEEGLNVLKNQPRDESHVGRGGNLSHVVWALLNTFAEKGDVDKTKEILQILVSRGFVQPNNVILGPVVKAHMVNDDVSGALAFFETSVQEHHCTPWKQELCARFIEADDAERLQKVMDLSTSLHGEVNSLYDLLFVFIQCGKIRQAKKILEIPGIRARNDKLEITCNRLLQEDRVSELENLIEVTRELVDADRNSMYFYLLKAYCKQNDEDKALSVWTTMQEENVQPSADLLIFLADFLRKNNRPVPFIVPEATQFSRDRLSKGIEGEGYPLRSKEVQLVKEFRTALELRDVDKALQIKQKLESEHAYNFSVPEKSFLIDRLTRVERLGEATRLAQEMLQSGFHPLPSTLRFLVLRLGLAGDLDTLVRLEKQLTPDLNRRAFMKARQTIAYGVLGRGKEYVDNFISKAVDQLSDENKDWQHSGDISLLGTMFLLNKDEGLLPQVIELSRKAEQKGNLVLTNALWAHHMNRREFDSARHLWTSSLKGKNPMFRVLISDCRRKKDLEIARELENQILGDDQLPNRSKAMAVAGVVDVHCLLEEPELGLNHLKESLNTFQLEDFPDSTMHLLKAKLEGAGKMMPFPVPKNTRQRRADPTSSSDSEDSD